ncbi:tRNA (uridine(54)-C5)-methyltransferase TrmA [Halieaceae bacterium IMCC14734]|uniref:tRNA/tmRNA (uracil-C(5))-methyltransferase n=1 Tax=Candidatus Litorirhabdus singularis TaxID=2518993 RepID=A0ABT3TJ52_9GAMM|nr:tRNA (uridine(54)-C5)-methyltransferase TrmA [Candidatus Litorirhabdus singularis]MCX2981392.1 tRNA (uridine(54)-C5)-methyltransferase TrmA [Candidatus Litorirhabdus singularis]
MVALSAFQPHNYDALLQSKREHLEQLLAPFSVPATKVFDSPPDSFRMRAEFRIWHDGDDMFYAMFDPGRPRDPLRVDTFPIASQRIQTAMQPLLDKLLANPELRRKLFQVEFLSTQTDQLLITLIYHRQLDDTWQEQAAHLETALDAKVIGRARKQRLVLSQDYVDEQLTIGRRVFHYRQFEQGFTQPNANVNSKMIEWACEQARGCSGDLLELYCGNGNFTLPLAGHFDKVLATEVSKASMNSARFNQQRNNINNLELVRLAAEEVVEALAGARPFRRLAHLENGLAGYNFGTVFVDPPRAGLDAATEKLVSQFDNIIYISCNPVTLAGNLESICRTHSVQACALFDQFPYTQHVECGVLLQRR